MTVQEFYDWCKARKITDAEMEISLKFAGLDLSGVKVSEINIDYGKVKLPQGKERKYIRFGG